MEILGLMYSNGALLDVPRKAALLRDIRDLDDDLSMSKFLRHLKAVITGESRN